MKSFFGFGFGCLMLMSFSAIAGTPTKTFCGKRDGTAGNAALVDKKGNEVITLAMQGGDQSLLEKADELIPGGTQNGRSYCVVAEVNSSGEPTKIIKAYKKK